jgi:hypothetical protein
MRRDVSWQDVVEPGGVAAGDAGEQREHVAVTEQAPL